VTASTTVIAALGGYAVARLRFPGREAVASLILILYLIPPALLFIPLYRVLAEIGATDHLSALFLSYPTFTVPFCTWLLIGFFKALPDELEEAALIDGASRATAFVRVLLPLAAPGLVASAIFAFTLSLERVPLRPRLHPGRALDHGAGGPQPPDLRRRLPLGPAHGRLRDHDDPGGGPLRLHPPVHGRGARRGIGEGVILDAPS